MRSRLRNSTIVAATAIIVGCGISSAALAAPASGTYTGSTADGSYIALVVGTDSNGEVAITSASINFTATCMPGGTAFSSGWGYRPDAVIAKEKFSYVESFAYLYQPVKGTFSGNTITGTIASLAPTFAAVTKGAPKKSVFCTSPSQSFTASLSPAAIQPAPTTAFYDGRSK